MPATRLTYTRGRIAGELQSDLQDLELSPTAVRVLDTLVELMVPTGPTKILPGSMHILDGHLAKLSGCRVSGVRKAVIDLEAAGLVQLHDYTDYDRHGRLRAKVKAFDISPAILRVMDKLTQNRTEAVLKPIQ